MPEDLLFPPPATPAGQVVHRIREGGRALVALSGGVDSALVASLAYSALGPDALAVTLSGPAVARREVERAREVARAIGIPHVILAADPLLREAYRANREDRCYHCRTVETSVMVEFGATHSVVQYLDGVQRDDLADDRPGIRAMNEAGFAHPLLWAGWGKAEVRVEARRRDLPNWDQPSDACLSSRIERGEPVTRPLLERVESAEGVLLDLGFRRVRVRVRQGEARVEVDPSEVARLRSEPLAGRVVRELRRLGFANVTLDPLGYRGGLGALPMVR